MAADSSFHGGRKSMGGTIHHRKAEKYSFPLLKNDEIIQCLAELNVQLDEADLAKARPAQLRHIYELLLCDCLDMTKEELYQPKFSGLDALRHAELHDDSVPVLHFFRSMCVSWRSTGVCKHSTLGLRSLQGQAAQSMRHFQWFHTEGSQQARLPPGSAQPVSHHQLPQVS